MTLRLVCLFLIAASLGASVAGVSAQRRMLLGAHTAAPYVKTKEEVYMLKVWMFFFFYEKLVLCFHIFTWFNVGSHSPESCLGIFIADIFDSVDSFRSIESSGTQTGSANAPSGQHELFERVSECTIKVLSDS